jgi:hypothetical protein
LHVGTLSRRLLKPDSGLGVTCELPGAVGVGPAAFFEFPRQPFDLGLCCHKRLVLLINPVDMMPMALTHGIFDPL